MSATSQMNPPGSQYFQQSMSSSVVEPVSESLTSHPQMMSDIAKEAGGINTQMQGALDQFEEGEVEAAKQKVLFAASCVVLVGMVLLMHQYFEEKEEKLRDLSNDPPRLAHVVSEYQGMRRPNWIGLGVMALTGSSILLIATLYRKKRIEYAGKHDSVFWMLCTLSVSFGVVFLIYRWRRRRQDKVREGLKDMAQKTKLFYKNLAFILPAIPAGIFGFLMYLRRKRHIHELKRRKEKARRHKKTMEGGEDNIM